mgnify:CR=1 FL=1
MDWFATLVVTERSCVGGYDYKLSTKGLAKSNFLQSEVLLIGLMDLHYLELNQL